MILTGRQIAERQGEDIFITPFNKSQLNPNSYNLRLHSELLVYDEPVLDMKKPNRFKKIIIPATGLKLEPDTLYLGRTVEHTRTDNCVPMLEGRSSIGRLGLAVHISAGFGDVGFNGFWTLELFCVQPVIIYPNIEICQIYYHDINGDCDTYAGGKYNNNEGIQPSFMFKEFRKTR